jgi:hypothetical protein
MSSQEIARQLAVTYAGKGDGPKAFNRLLDLYNGDPETRAKANTELLEIVRPADSFVAATTISLLGLLGVQQAESELLQLIKSKFPDAKLKMLAGMQPRQIRLEHLIFSNTIASLIKLNSTEGKALASRLVEELAGTWVERTCRKGLEVFGNKGDAI